MPDDQEDKTIYNVVVSHEEQYSIWPAHRGKCFRVVEMRARAA